eukprot:scaffold3166_cov399-Prasinococcus_capsulatus_cf.AAC.18
MADSPDDLVHGESAEARRSWVALRKTCSTQKQIAAVMCGCARELSREVATVESDTNINCTYVTEGLSQMGLEATPLGA